MRCEACLRLRPRSGLKRFHSRSNTTCKLDVGPPTPTPTPRLPVVVSITVFDEAPTKVTLSTLLKSSVPWGVAMGHRIYYLGRLFFHSIRSRVMVAGPICTGDVEVPLRRKRRPISGKYSVEFGFQSALATSMILVT